MIVRNPKQPWRKLSRSQLETLEAAATAHGVFLTSRELCGHISSSPDSLWRLGFLVKVAGGLDRQPKYQINDAGVAAIGQSERTGA